MRWSMDGAQAILDLRSVSLNGDWAAFWRYRAAREKVRLYGGEHVSSPVEIAA